jgi:hypothetical protein
VLNEPMAFFVIVICGLSGKSNQATRTIIKWSLASWIKTFCNHAAPFSLSDLIPILAKTAGGQRAIRCPPYLKFF